MAQMTEPRYDPAIEQYVAALPDGREVYGNTWTECARRRADALHTMGKHQAENGGETLGAPEADQIVLEVTGYARGRIVTDKQVSRVRVNGADWRDATNSDFESALNWLMGEGYDLKRQTLPTTRMGTATVRYTYIREPQSQYRDSAEAAEAAAVQ